MWQQLISNPVFVTAMIGWFLSGFLKIPIEYAVTHKWNWGLWFSPGGMPSSHSTLVTCTMLSTGLYAGFDTPVFAVAFTVMMIVVYDAAGVRRQAGIHAKKINKIIEELMAGHPLSEDQLKEVLGHTPRQVVMGVVLGLVIALVVWLFWH